MNSFPGILLTGVRSGQWYLQQLQQTARKLKGDEYILPLKILQTPFEEINVLLPHNIEKAAQKLLPYLMEMKQMKAQPFILANITLHETFNFYKENQAEQIPIISISDVLKAKLPKSAKKIVVLGTYYTMSSNYISSQMPEHIYLETIDKGLKEKVNKLRILFNTEVDASFANEVFNELLNTYPDVDCFVLGCTELSLALEYFNTKSPFFNLPKFQCDQLVETYLLG